MTDRRLDDLNRNEQYFTAMLLPMFLMHDGGRGARALLRMLADKGADIDPDTPWDAPLEVVPELDVRPDIPVHLKQQKQAADEGTRAALEKPASDAHRPHNVLDTVLRIGSNLIVIEGKFFTPIVASEVLAQVRAQADEARIARAWLGETINKQVQVLLIPEEEPFRKALDATPDHPAIVVLTWREIAEACAKIMGADDYVTTRLREAVQRCVPRYGRGATEPPEGAADLEIVSPFLGSSAVTRPGPGVIQIAGGGGAGMTMRLHTTKTTGKAVTLARFKSLSGPVHLARPERLQTYLGHLDGYTAAADHWQGLLDEVPAGSGDDRSVTVSLQDLRDRAPLFIKAVEAWIAATRQV